MSRIMSKDLIKGKEWSKNWENIAKYSLRKFFEL